MITGRLVRGVFTRIGAYGAQGAKALVRMAPRSVMNTSSLRLGRIAGNVRKVMASEWRGPGLSAIRNLQSLPAFGMNSIKRYAPGIPWVTFGKTIGLQANHAATEGLGLALSKGRHSNLL